MTSTALKINDFTKDITSIFETELNTAISDLTIRVFGVHSTTITDLTPKLSFHDRVVGLLYISIGILTAQRLTALLNLGIRILPVQLRLLFEKTQTGENCIIRFKCDRNVDQTVYQQGQVQRQ